MSRAPGNERQQEKLVPSFCEGHPLLAWTCSWPCVSLGSQVSDCCSDCGKDSISVHWTKCDCSTPPQSVWSVNKDQPMLEDILFFFLCFLSFPFFLPCPFFLTSFSLSLLPSLSHSLLLPLSFFLSLCPLKNNQMVVNPVFF